MAQSSDQSKTSMNADPAKEAPASVPVGRNTATADVKNDNLAFTNPDEYKHKHGEHKHHHHHHHHHHHRHFHILSLSPSGIRDNLKLLFKTIYAYPYILLFFSLVFLFFMTSGVALKLLDARKAGFSSLETYYQWQEYLTMNQGILIHLPFQITLVVSVGITLFLMQQQERHWQRNVLKLLPALGAAAIFSIPVGGDRAKSDEISARGGCRDCLRNYHVFCIEHADINDGQFPDELPVKSSPAARFDSDHFIYHGAGKKAGDEPFILLEDKDGSHIGNYRYAIQSNGTILEAKYGGLYEEYKGKQTAAETK